MFHEDPNVVFEAAKATAHPVFMAAGWLYQFLWNILVCSGHCSN